MKTLYDFSLKDIDGNTLNLAKFKGKVVLVVNVASKCGLTGQYKPLQALYEKYEPQGLVVLGLPCNQFMEQEPGTEEQIKTFCSTKFDVTFPMTSKVEVNGEGRDPLYVWLVGEDGDIQWNFEKFVIGRDGYPAARFDPKLEPDDEVMVELIEAELAPEA